MGHKPMAATNLGEMASSYVVSVVDTVAEALVGDRGLSYTSPPQPYPQALALARALLDVSVEPPRPGQAYEWTRATAGGRRLVMLSPHDLPSATSPSNHPAPTTQDTRGDHGHAPRR
jgi:hypothetical protein